MDRVEYFINLIITWRKLGRFRKEILNVRSIKSPPPLSSVINVVNSCYACERNFNCFKRLFTLLRKNNFSAKG